MDALNHGVVPREVLLNEKGIDLLRGLIERRHPNPPFSQTTSIYLVEAEVGKVVFEGVPSAAFLNPLGTVHGGWTGAILDSAMGCAVHTTLEARQGYTTVEMKVNMVRPILPSTGKVRCEGVVIHRGQNIATSEGRLVDANGKLLAHGTETCMIMTLSKGR
jgi:uncharacterized protein (TIGR00369 family)